MSLNRQLTIEQYPELFEYAYHVLKENPKCSTIMRWVKDHSYKLENFFLAYTLMKHGNYYENSYKNVINEFKEKHKIELEEYYSGGFYSHRLWSYKDNPLYSLALQQIEQNQNTENKVNTEFKI